MLSAKLLGDLTFNKGNQSRNIGALVDIRTQKVFLTLNRSKRTQDVIGNMNKKLKQLSHIIKSITLDSLSAKNTSNPDHL
ncbi:hypothetical protein [Rickettsia endosymbiont of Urophora cardui]|uniref:hypothetical protein n=1 Tax=Rickettsia endosymbiont of Urophora cardui TaxID=3066265 RepID=UPI00313A9B9B